MLSAKELPFPELSPELFHLLRGKHIFCGFSGGSDSLFLLLLLKENASRGKYDLSAVHFEHGFRGRASLDDAAWCREFCEKNAISFELVPLDVPRHKKRGESDETAARRLRLDFWKKRAAQNSSSVVALGHNADDGIENFFLRLARGSNASGLTSLREIAALDGMILIRPVLFYQKCVIEKMLLQRGFADWRRDATNEEAFCSRNILRLKILPELYEAFPFAKKGILHSLEILSGEAQILEKLSSDAYEKLSDPPHPEEFLKTAAPLRARLLRRYLSEKLHEDFIPDLALISRFNDSLKRLPPGGETLRIPLKERSEYLALRSDAVLVGKTFPQEKERTIPAGDQETVFCGKKFSFRLLQPGEVLGKVCFDADLIGEKLILSFWKHGDKLIPFGRKTPVPVKKLLTEKKIRSSDRERTVIVRNGAGVPIWIPGIRTSAESPVTKETKRVLYCSFEDCPEE